MSFRRLTFIMLFALTATFAFAQSEIASSDADAMLPTISEVSAKSVFATDPDSKICFIDFMKIDGYAKQLIVKNAAGDVVLDEPVWELPENTLYELDYNEYKEGNYTVEIQTYSTAIKQQIKVK